MDKLNIYKIDGEYIKYLQQFEPNICEPKEYGYTRPYIGILVKQSKKFYYFAPLTSKTNKPDFYCFKLYNSNNQPIAGIRINNMIPVPIESNNLFSEYKYSILLKSKDVQTRKYGQLLKAEVEAMSNLDVKLKIYTKAKFFYNNYPYNHNIQKISNNFKMLEIKALQYKKN